MLPHSLLKEKSMLHIFHFRDRHYVYDTGSGALHICDEKTARYLSGEQVSLTEEELADLALLRAQGLLDKEEIKTYPRKSSKVKALCLHISHDCNLRCQYCFADEGAYHAVREVMSLETAKAAIDFLIKESGTRRILEVDFFGGEPLMNFSVLKETVAYAKAEGEKHGKKFLFTTTTNALLLDDEKGAYLNEEMENVVLSLDGRPEVHDAVRKTVNGKGSYAAVIENVKKFVKSRGDKHYYVRGTFTAKNLDFSKDVLYLADQGFQNISMEPVVTDIPELQIKEEHLPIIEREYEILLEEYIKRQKEGKGFLFFHFNIDLEGGPCLQKRVSACGAGNEYFSVVPNGDLYPCHQFAGEAPWKMGTVFEGKIDEALRAKFAENCLFTRNKCGDCFAKFICSGGCSANNYHFCGDVNEPYPISCAMMKKRSECAMHALAECKMLTK